MTPAKPSPINPLSQLYIAGGKRHAAYRTTVDIYDALKIHIKGEYPEKLIGERRPNESDKIWAFRKAIYQPITKDTPNRVITSLGKIRRSPDWSIKYPDTELDNKIPEGESLSDYFGKNYPYHTSLTNWAFKIMLKNMITDPNAVLIIVPSNINHTATELLKPIPLTFHSPDVLGYEAGEFVLVKYKDKETQTGEGLMKYIAVDKEKIQWLVNDGKSIRIADEYVHDLGYLPVARLGGTYCKNEGAQIIYDSFIDPMLPYLNEAAREYSDHQAEILQHIFSETWEWASQNCATCKNDMGLSIGKVKPTTGKSLVRCPDCNGTGISPYNKLIIRPAKVNMGEQPAPIPPKGFIEKNTEIARLQDERIEKHRYRALCSINFQFLDSVPAAQSGIAKEVDRDELNNFVYNVAEVLVENMDWVIKVSTDYRYETLIPNPYDREKLLPTIPVPQKFDLVSTGYLISEYQAAKTANMTGLVLSALEEEYVTKKFIADPEILEVLQLTFNLDPIPSRSTDEKMVMFQNGAVTKQAYIVSSNVTAFVKRALEEYKDFDDWEHEKQIALFNTYAEEIITANSAKAEILPAVQ